MFVAQWASGEGKGFKIIKTFNSNYCYISKKMDINYTTAHVKVGALDRVHAKIENNAKPKKKPILA